MSTAFAFKQSLHLCSVSNLRTCLVLQLRNFKVRFSGPKTFRGFSRNGPQVGNLIKKTMVLMLSRLALNHGVNAE